MKFREFMDRYAKIYMIACMIILLGAVGITYAYYAMTVSDSSTIAGEGGGGSAPTISVSKVSTSASDSLIPIDMTTDMLTKAATASPKCVDKNGYSVCQIYSVTVTNNSNLSQQYNITLDNLYGANTPNVDAVSMGTSNSEVTDASSIKGTGNICTTNSVGKGKTTNTCYFMVLIKNLDTAQTDNGTFGGTVTATSTTGGEVKASFGEE